MNRPPGAGEAAPGEQRFAIAVTVLFAIVLGTALWHHEMWRDELQAWAIARDSASLAQLWTNTRYEGHTALWYVLLFVASRLVRTPAAMQLLQGLVAVATTWLIASRAPLPRAWRALLPFGYFLAYDYGVISRPYGLGVLLLVGWCIVRTARPRAWLLPALLLALLANTSVYGALLAATAFASMLVPALREGAVRAASARILLATAIVGLGGVAAATWMMPPAEFRERAVEAPAAEVDDRLVEAVDAPIRAFVPLPAPHVHPYLWTSNALINGGGPRRREAAAIVGILLVVIITAGFRQLDERVLFAGFSIAYLAFSYFVYVGNVYHHGHLVLAFLAALWLARGDTRWPRPLVTGALALHVLAALMMLWVDLREPFSGARGGARLLARASGGNTPIVAVPASVGTGVAAFLDRPLFFPARGYAGTFVRWNVTGPYGECDNAAIAIAGARQLLGGGAPEVLLSLTEPLGPVPGDLAIEQLGGVTRTIAYDDVLVYRATRRPGVEMPPEPATTSASCRR